MKEIKIYLLIQASSYILNFSDFVITLKIVTGTKKPKPIQLKCRLMIENTIYSKTKMENQPETIKQLEQLRHKWIDASSR